VVGGTVGMKVSVLVSYPENLSFLTPLRGKEMLLPQERTRHILKKMPAGRLEEIIHLHWQITT